MQGENDSMMDGARCASTTGATPLAAAVADVEMAALDRLRHVLPVFLWLWEHRAEVKPLLRDGASWHALSAGLARVGFVERAGSVPREEYCRAAWSRVLAYEAMMVGTASRTTETGEAGSQPGAPGGCRMVEPPSDQVSQGPTLNQVLAKARRPSLSEPPPLNVGNHGRRAVEGGEQT